MKKPCRHTFAFSLVEVTLALGLAVFSLISILGLLPVGISSNQASIEQTTAANLGRLLLADLHATPGTNPPTDQTSPLSKITVPGSGNATHTLFLGRDGTPLGAVDADAVPSADPNLNPRYRATIVFSASANASQKTATAVRILITWPAMADKTASEMPSKYSGSYEVLTALNRN